MDWYAVKINQLNQKQNNIEEFVFWFFLKIRQDNTDTTISTRPIRKERYKQTENITVFII